jgi:hypothetical protein
MGRLRPNSPEMPMPDLPEHGHASPRPPRTVASQKAEGLSRAGGHPANPKSSTAVFAEISASAVISGGTLHAGTAPLEECVAATVDGTACRAPVTPV